MRRVLWIVALAGCDRIADRGYVGEPMFTIVGSFAAPPEASVGGVALMWQDSAGAGGPGVAATIVPVELEFPATFRVAVPVPPPDAARFVFDDSDVELAEAYVHVVEDPEAARPVTRGLSRTHVLVYASGAVGEGTQAAQYLGGAIDAGYHLRRFVRDAAPGGAQQVMIDRCAAVSLRAACAVRRAYRLAAAADDEHLRIVVAP